MNSYPCPIRWYPIGHPQKNPATVGVHPNEQGDPIQPLPP